LPKNGFIFLIYSSCFIALLGAFLRFAFDSSENVCVIFASLLSLVCCALDLSRKQIIHVVSQLWQEKKSLLEGWAFWLWDEMLTPPKIFLHPLFLSLLNF